MSSGSSLSGDSDSETYYNPLPILPPELYDIIIDHLHDDKPTLYSLSLTTRRWVGSAQYHLFHTKRIGSYDSNLSPALYAFSNFLQRSPHISAYIRTLHLHSLSDAVRIRVKMDAASIFVSVARTLSGLRTLVLEHVLLDRPLPSGKVEHSIVSLKYLKLHDVSAEGGSLGLLLDTCPVYDTLEIVHSNVVELKRSQPQVKHLKIKNQSSGTSVFPSFHRDTRFPELATLSVDVVNDDVNEISLGDLSQFLHRNGSDLQHLRLNISEMKAMETTPDDSLAIFHLRFICPLLHTLHLGFQLYLPGRTELFRAESQASLNLIVRILSSAPRTLTAVAFELDILGTLGRNDESDVDWERLSGVLDRFPRLASVRFLRQWARGNGSYEMRDSLKELGSLHQTYFNERFSSLASKGVLHFV